MAYRARERGPGVDFTNEEMGKSGWGRGILRWCAMLCLLRTRGIVEDPFERAVEFWGDICGEAWRLGICLSWPWLSKRARSARRLPCICWFLKIRQKKFDASAAEGLENWPQVHGVAVAPVRSVFSSPMLIIVLIQNLVWRTKLPEALIFRSLAFNMDSTAGYSDR